MYRRRFLHAHQKAFLSSGFVHAGPCQCEDTIEANVHSIPLARGGGCSSGSPEPIENAGLFGLPWTAVPSIILFSVGRQRHLFRVLLRRQLHPRYHVLLFQSCWCHCRLRHAPGQPPLPPH